VWQPNPHQGRVDSPDLGIDILMTAWSLDPVARTPGSLAYDPFHVGDERVGWL